MKKNRTTKTENLEAFSLADSKFYNEFLAEREEIMKHKWIESEKAGTDIGFERALLDWVMNYREKWRTARRPHLKNASKK